MRTTKTVQAGGIRIATEAFGRPGDPAIVLIMGATASMLGWPDGLCAALAGRGFHVIRFDHRDTGGSTTLPPGAAEYDVEDMADDVIAVMGGYRIDAAHLVGMSLGGFIAQMLALSHADRVLSLTLIASEPLGWDGDPLPHIAPAFMDHFGGMDALDWSDASAVSDFLLGIDRLSAGTGHPFDAEDQRARIARVLDRTDSIASMFNHASRDTRGDWDGAFRRISQPALIIHGSDDRILPPANGQALAAGIGGATLDILPGVGHELPARVHGRITGLIAAHVSRANSR